MIKTIIIEDEKPAARRLQKMLQKQHFEVVDLLHSVGEAVTWFKKNPHPELIFLDIQLSDGFSFEIFDQIEVRSAIIFTTAYAEHALKAFKLNSIDYLLKPIDENELRFAIEKYKTNHNHGFPDLSSLKKMILQTEQTEYKERFSVQYGQHIQLVKTAEIECFYSQDKASYIHTKNAKNHLLDISLEQIEKQLNPKDFFRVNRKFIIKIDRIKDIIYYSNSRLKIILNSYNEQDIIVARERVKDFKTWISG